MENRFDDQKILDYLDGVLEEGDKRLFENELENNSELQERLDLLLFTINAIKLKGYKHTIRQVQQEFIQEKLENKKFTPFATPKLERKKVPLIFWSKVAAAVSLLVLFGFIFYLLRTDGPSLYER